MSYTKKYRFSVDVAKDLSLKFADLPSLIAKALRQPHDAPKLPPADLWDIERELTADAQRGRLVVCHPETLAAYTPPIPEVELNSSVVIPEHYLVDYLGATRGIEVRLKSHGLGPIFWTFENAAVDVQKILEWEGPKGKTFLSYLLEEAQKGEISVFDPDTLTAFDPSIRGIRPHNDFVCANDVWDCYFLGGDMYLRADEIGSWPNGRISDVNRPPSLRDKKPWMTEEHFARPGLYLYQQAAWEIADAEKWDDATFQDFLFDLSFAIRSNQLAIFKPRTGISASPETQTKWFVTVEGVNDWLAKRSHLAYRWERLDGSHSVVSEEGPTPTEISRRAVRKRTWRDVAMPYIVQFYKSGQYSTAKALYNALEKRAGSEGSPFEKGVGPHAHSLFVREIAQSVALKTIQTAWLEIRESN